MVGALVQAMHGVRCPDHRAFDRLPKRKPSNRQRLNKATYKLFSVPMQNATESSFATDHRPTSW
ncbi:hypothetical protein LN458_16735, partial [Xanthomonas arboricola]|uniref:hypothetical protein n=1 Tax=Xanthomonas arboricola TaxID=56448 RepID=UPI001E376F05